MTRAGEEEQNEVGEDLGEAGEETTEEGKWVVEGDRD